jgi:dihydroorotase
VHIGEPGAEHRETIASASRAAAKGGVTSIIMMPDTDPVIDDVALVDFVQRLARDEAMVMFTRPQPSPRASRARR